MLALQPQRLSLAGTPSAMVCRRPASYNDAIGPPPSCAWRAARGALRRLANRLRSSPCRGCYATCLRTQLAASSDLVCGFRQRSRAPLGPSGAAPAFLWPLQVWQQASVVFSAQSEACVGGHCKAPPKIEALVFLASAARASRHTRSPDGRAQPGLSALVGDPKMPKGWTQPPDTRGIAAILANGTRPSSQACTPTCSLPHTRFSPGLKLVSRLRAVLSSKSQKRIV